MKVMRYLLAALAIAGVNAAIFGEVCACPRGSCMRDKSVMSGMAGPCAMFHECVKSKNGNEKVTDVLVGNNNGDPNVTMEDAVGQQGAHIKPCKDSGSGSGSGNDMCIQKCMDSMTMGGAGGMVNMDPIATCNKKCNAGSDGGGGNQACCMAMMLSCVQCTCKNKAKRKGTDGSECMDKVICAQSPDLDGCNSANNGGQYLQAGEECQPMNVQVVGPSFRRRLTKMANPNNISIVPGGGNLQNVPMMHKCAMGLECMPDMNGMPWLPRRRLTSMPFMMFTCQDPADVIDPSGSCKDNGDAMSCNSVAGCTWKNPPSVMNVGGINVGGVKNGGVVNVGGRRRRRRRVTSISVGNISIQPMKGKCVESSNGGGGNGSGNGNNGNDAGCAVKCLNLFKGRRRLTSMLPSMEMQIYECLAKQCQYSPPAQMSDVLCGIKYCEHVTTPAGMGKCMCNSCNVFCDSSGPSPNTEIEQCTARCDEMRRMMSQDMLTADDKKEVARLFGRCEDGCRDLHDPIMHGQCYDECDTEIWGQSACAQDSNFDKCEEKYQMCLCNKCDDHSACAYTVPDAQTQKCFKKCDMYMGNAGSDYYPSMSPTTMDNYFGGGKGGKGGNNNSGSINIAPGKGGLGKGRRLTSMPDPYYEYDMCMCNCGDQGFCAATPDCSCPNMGFDPDWCDDFSQIREDIYEHMCWDDATATESNMQCPELVCGDSCHDKCYAYREDQNYYDATPDEQQMMMLKSDMCMCECDNQMNQVDYGTYQGSGGMGSMNGQGSGGMNPTHAPQPSGGMGSYMGSDTMFGMGPIDCKMQHKLDMCYHTCDKEHGFDFGDFGSGSDFGRDFGHGGGVLLYPRRRRLTSPMDTPAPTTYDYYGTSGSDNMYDGHMQCMMDCDMDNASPECKPCFKKMNSVEQADNDFYQNMGSDYDDPSQIYAAGEAHYMKMCEMQAEVDQCFCDCGDQMWCYDNQATLDERKETCTNSYPGSYYPGTGSDQCMCPLQGMMPCYDGEMVSNWEEVTPGCPKCEFLTCEPYQQCTDAATNMVYDHSQQWDAADGCNSCFCEDGNISCTEMDCNPCPQPMCICAPGEEIKMGKDAAGCDTCQCIVDADPCVAGADYLKDKKLAKTFKKSLKKNFKKFCKAVTKCNKKGNYGSDCDLSKFNMSKMEQHIIDAKAMLAASQCASAKGAGSLDGKEQVFPCDGKGEAAFDCVVHDIGCKPAKDKGGKNKGGKNKGTQAPRL